jgi:hypothetical protein
VSVAERVEAMVARYRGGLTEAQALILVAAESHGDPLDPRSADDAAVILVAETLLEHGARVHDAISEARDHAAHSPQLANSQNGGSSSAAANEPPAPPTRPICPAIGHDSAWQARDGHWRCTSCEPPHFAGEILRKARLDP